MSQRRHGPAGRSVRQRHTQIPRGGDPARSECEAAGLGGRADLTADCWVHLH